MEVRERLDGRLQVRHREQILTAQEAPPLAAELRAQVVEGPAWYRFLTQRPHELEAPKSGQSTTDLRTFGRGDHLV